MPRRRVVITGIGVVSSIGFGAQAFGDSLKEGHSSISPFQSINTTGFPHCNGGEVKNFDPTAWLRHLDTANCGRTSQFAAAAARMAIEDAGLDPASLDALRCGSCVGTTDGESQVIERIARQWISEGPANVPSKLFPMFAANRLAVSVNQELAFRGEAITISNACAAGNYAIGHAFDLVQTGEADYMVCGGADNVHQRGLAGFTRLGAVSPEVCRPFDKNRQGLLTGEGSGMLVLESLESARARGVRVYAEILGYGLNCDAQHMVAPDPTSIAECMRKAHKNAGIQPQQINYICAHGTGTPANDRVESAAIHEVFGDQIPPTSSIKSMLGHTMGAASALGAVACALALHESFIPPTINFTEADPACVKDCVPNQARFVELNVVQNNGFAFGGNNAVLILGRETWISQHLY